MVTQNPDEGIIPFFVFQRAVNQLHAGSRILGRESRDRQWETVIRSQSECFHAYSSRCRIL